MRLIVALVVLALGVSVISGMPPAVAAPDFDLQAHRGGRGETTEESLRAFAKALEVGVSTLEFDIVITGDGQPLVWHDPVIEPTKCTDTAPAFPGDPQYPYVGKLVHDLTLPQIRTLDCGKLLTNFPSAEVVSGNKIATLPEVFDLTAAYGADVRYNIETKVEADKPQMSASPQEFVDVILGVVRAAGKVDRVEIQSFDWRTLPLVRQAEPAIPLVALWDETTYVPNSPWLAGVNPAVVARPHRRCPDGRRQHPVTGILRADGLDAERPGLSARRRSGFREPGASGRAQGDPLDDQRCRCDARTDRRRR